MSLDPSFPASPKVNIINLQKGLSVSLSLASSCNEALIAAAGQEGLSCFYSWPRFCASPVTHRIDRDRIGEMGGEAKEHDGGEREKDALGIKCPLRESEVAVPQGGKAKMKDETGPAPDLQRLWLRTHHPL